MRRRQQGSVLVEFSLMGTIFLMLWVLLVEMGIGMWQYHTIQGAVKMAGSYTVLHGSDCSTAGNSCSIKIKDIATLLKSQLPGVDPTQVSVTFNALASDHTTVNSTVTCTLSGGTSPCTSNTTAWPPTGSNSPGDDIEILTEYQFHSILSSVYLPGFTHQMIVF